MRHDRGEPRPATRRHRRGAEALEMALVMPVLVLILGGMMDLGWLFYTESSLDAAINIGCREGALIDPGPDESNLEEVRRTTEEALIRAMVQQGVGDCAEGCSAEVALFGSQPGRTLSCEVELEYTPLLGMVLDEMTLSASQVVRMEWQRR